MSARTKILLLVFLIGQTSANGAEVVCSSSVPPINPTTAYSDNLDGTATHLQTGLMWKVCSEGQTWGNGVCIGTQSFLTWAKALETAAISQFAGHTDWRVPNVRELRSLVERCRANPAINNSIFPLELPVFAYWSSSPAFDNIGRARIVYFDRGHIADESMLSFSSVRLVRGGKSSASFDSATVPTPAVISAQFAATPTSGAAELTVRFTGIGTSNLSTDVLTYEWDFGDGSTSTLRSPSHTFRAAGIFNVVLKVSNATGQSALSTVQNITVTGSTTVTDADKVFTWAEITYPAFFAPANSTSLSITGYRYRAYSGGSFLAVNDSGTAHLYYLGPLSGNTVLDLGPLTTWLTQAGP